MQEVAGECSPLPPISRVRRSVEEARRAYDRMSAWYDLFGGFGERRCIELGLDLLGVRTGERVLEVGCGTGSALVPLARSAGKSGKVYGLDLSSGMAHRTRERLDRASLGGRVPLILGDGATLPLAEDAVDAIFVSFTLELFDTSRIPLALAECRRVLNANGRMCVVSLAKRGTDSLSVRIYEWLHRALPRYVDCRPIPVGGLLREAGFRIMDVRRRSMWALPIDLVLCRVS